jgi:hypothetical protein
MSHHTCAAALVSLYLVLQIERLANAASAFCSSIGYQNQRILHIVRAAGRSSSRRGRDAREWRF